LMLGVHRHYEHIFRETAKQGPADLSGISSPIVVLPMERWSRVGEKALRFAYAISNEILVLHIATPDEEPKPDNTNLRKIWGDYIEKPAKQAGLKPPELVVLHS